VNYRRWAVLGICVLTVASALALVVAILLRPPGYLATTDAYWAEFRTHADISAIQAWLRKAALPEGDSYKLLLPKDWPACLKWVDPSKNRVEVNGYSVRVQTGGGFGHVGVVIMCPEDALRIPGPYREYRKWVAAGVYAWHDLQ
jgi:hypothetical protein